MQEIKIDYKHIDEIINHVIEMIMESKDQIFEIAESSRNEYKKLEDEFKNLKFEVHSIIDETQKIEIKLRNYKSKLTEVNRNFDKYSESEAKRIYEETDNLRVELIVKREREKFLINRRTEIERSLILNKRTVEKAEKMIESVGISLGFLKGDILKMTAQLGEVQDRHFVGVKVIQAQEAERQRVGREIHDGPAQSMSNIVLKAEICEKLLSVDKERTKVELNNLKQLTRNTLQEVRRIIYDLRPMSLDDLGLIPTLDRYFTTFEEDNGIKIRYKASDGFNNINKTLTVSVFRIIQEALNNVKKYANAKNVVVVLKKSNMNVTVFISDDGKGFDIKKLDNIDPNIEGGFGLIGMRERVDLLDGEFKIESEMDKGTQITVTIPCGSKED